MEDLDYDYIGHYGINLDFKNLSLEEQNKILRDAIIDISIDLQRLAEIVFKIQNNMRNVLSVTDDNINKMDKKIDEHINSTHSYLIVKDKK